MSKAYSCVESFGKTIRIGRFDFAVNQHPHTPGGKVTYGDFVFRPGVTLDDILGLFGWAKQSAVTQRDIIEHAMTRLVEFRPNRQMQQLVEQEQENGK